MTPKEVLDFWFQELKPQQHFERSDAVDEKIRTRFAGVHGQANRCELFAWRETPEGRLAEIIVLDQFSRNMFRGRPESFASDTLALVLAQEAVHVGADTKLGLQQRHYFYMPYMHSESRVVHETAVKLFSTPGLEGGYDYELKHKAIIDRFGRFPHRNEILGRNSTPEELEFLKQPNSRF